MQTGPRGKTSRARCEKSHGKRPNKLTTKTLTDQDEEQLPRAAMEKSRIWRTNFKVTPLDSVVSAHPQNISHKLILANRPEEMRSTGPFYLAIIALNPKSKVWYKKQKRATPILDVDGRT